MKLHPDYQVIPSDELVHHVEPGLPIDISSWEEVPVGIGNVVLRLADGPDQFYLKLYNSHHDVQRVVQEVAFTEHAHEKGISVQQFLPVGDSKVGMYNAPSGGHPYTLTTAIAGSHPQSYDAHMLRQLATEHGRLHNVASSAPVTVASLDPDADYGYYPLEIEDGRLYDVSAKARVVYDGIRGVWDDFPHAPVPLDIVRSNILVDESGVTGLIDFEDLARAPMAFCLAGTLWDIRQAGGNATDTHSYIQRYQQERPLSNVENDCLDDLVIVRGLIALHGTLLTEGTATRLAQQQAQTLEAVLQNN